MDFLFVILVFWLKISLFEIGSKLAWEDAPPRLQEDIMGLELFIITELNDLRLIWQRKDDVARLFEYFQILLTSREYLERYGSFTYTWDPLRICVRAVHLSKFVLFKLPSYQILHRLTANGSKTITQLKNKRIGRQPLEEAQGEREQKPWKIED